MSGDDLNDIRELTSAGIQSFLRDHNEKLFRATQVHEWLWKQNCSSFDEMTNLPKPFRELLKEKFKLEKALPDRSQVSADGTVKVLFSLHDGHVVEGVLIPSEGRYTACVSSQVGCPLACSFCATGKLGFTRNLTAGEIYDQAFYLDHLAKDKSGKETGLSNLVYMGMGEPLMNLKNVKHSIDMIMSADGMGMSPQRITVSSLGIPSMILRIADEAWKTHFALSLHAATDETRNRLAPFAIRHPLHELKQALKYYYLKTGKRFTIEYILFQNVNDSEADARALAAFCKDFPVKINLLEYNQVEGTGLLRSSAERMKAFGSFLEKKNMVVNFRKSRGRDIDAACGQLAGKTVKPGSLSHEEQA